MATNLNISTNTTEVSPRDNSITITDNNTGNIVNISQQSAPIVTVSAVGIQGAIGPQGVPGEVAGSLVADSIIQPFTHITASSNISASGNISSNQLRLNNFLHWGTTTGDNGIIYDDGTKLQIGYNDTDIISIHDTETKVEIAGNLKTIGPITASGNISASGTGSFSALETTGNATVDGDVFVSRYIRHTGDNDTHIEFLNNKLQLHAGNLPFITLDKDASTPYPLTINNGGNRINFRIQDKDSNLLFKTNSEEFWAGLYFAGNQKLVTAAGGIDVTGNVTASGNISSSGNIIGLTGSFSKTVITLESGTEDPPFLIVIEDNNGQDEKLQMTKDGVLRFGALDTLPTAITGGLVYSSSAFYMGLEC